MIKAIVIIINRSFKQGLSEDALYEATRGDWARINAEKKQADYAVAVADGVIRSVYRIEMWEDTSGNRQRFTGSPANDMAEYIGRNVGRKKPGDQSPIYFTDDLEGFVEGGGFQGVNIVEEQHVLQAFDYIRGKGVREENYGAFSVSERSKARSKAVVHEECLYAVKDTIRIAYLYAIGQKSDEQGSFSEKQIEMFDDKMAHIEGHWQSQRAAYWLKKLGFKIRDFDKIKEEVIMSKNSDSYLNLLLQFKQIILFGPPGTGKTFGAKKLLKELFGVKTEDELKSLRKNFKLWDIVQFHPSYNYEDFVRGIQAETTKNGQVAYKTLNKTFGVMCQVATKEYEDAKEKKREPKNYALIIDEINRANLSAVLGELIYALEYRDEEIKTPYEVEVEGQGVTQWLTVPENLYIIGTMNTADRTIGQIDYAVRRRFAFVSCPPDKDVIEDKEARNFFDKVNKIFDKEYISPDFDEKDVRIGHSYFMASGYELANNIIYQVIPILREYVKDGVLTSNAEKSINEIEKSTKDLLVNESEESDSLVNDEGGQQSDRPKGFSPQTDEESKQWLCWKHEDGDKHAILSDEKHLVREVITDFINKNLDRDVGYFNKMFKYSTPCVLPFERAKRANISMESESYFIDPKYFVKLYNGEVVAIKKEWMGVDHEKFKQDAAQHGYSIGQCYIVSMGENSRREWRYCYELDFIAAGGSPAYHTVMQNLKQGDIVFAYLSGSGVDDSDKGVICYGEVTDTAKLISEFESPQRKLLSDYCLDDGETYREKFPDAFPDNSENKFPDMAVRVNWLSEPLERPIKFKGAPRAGHLIRFSTDIMRELQKRFNLGFKESEMTSQSSSGNKRSQGFRWKHEDDDKHTHTLGVGHTARESIEHFIKKNSDKDIGYFKKKFDPVKDGSHERVVSREESKKDGGRYFTKFPVTLDNGEVVVISNDWGAGGPTYTRIWKQFKDRMAELGYSIIIDGESDE